MESAERRSRERAIRPTPRFAGSAFYLGRWSGARRLDQRVRAPRRTVALREEERRLREVPAEVDLGTGDLVLVVKGENLGIPSPSSAGGVGLIGNDHLVARLDQPDELEVLAAAGAGPATLEVAVTVELWVRWRREEKVIAQALLEEAPVAGCKRGI